MVFSRQIAGQRGRLAAVFALGVLVVGCGGAGGDRDRAAAASAEAAALRAGPNLVLVTLDTLRADHLGIYGYDAIETPRIDRFARDGVRFEQVTSPVPITLPAHASILTGRIPPRHGVRNNGSFQLGDEAVTLAEVLRSGGYETGGFVAAFVLDARFGTAQGFDTYTDFSRQVASVEATPFLKIQRRGEEVVEDALGWIGAREGPFFAWVHLYDPHTPYEPPAPFDGLYSERPYDGEIAYTDHAVGRLQDGLEALGRLDDTLIVITADHGEGLGDHGEQWHTFFIYDSTVRVPLIFWQPERLPAGTVAAGGASLVDILPTCLALLGVADPEESRRDGTDLRPRIVDPELPGRPAYTESLVPLLNFGWSELRGVRADGWKYIEAPRSELYELRADPAEAENLVAAEQERAESLRATLETMVGDDDATAAVGGQVEVDPASLERLRALGYLGGGGSVSLERDVDPKDKVEVFERFNDGIDAVIEMVLEERWNEAAYELDELERFVPDHFLVRFYLGKVALAQGRIEAAIESLEAALDLEPSYSLSYVELAKAYEADGQVDRAVELLREAARANPEVTSLPLELGYLQQRQGDLAEAVESYRAALRLLPDNPLLLSRVANLYLALGRPGPALESLQTLVEVTPDDALAWGNLGMVLGGMGRLDDAEGAFRRALDLDPEQPRLHYNLGVVLLRSGRRQEAADAFRRALEIDPGFAEARAQLATIIGAPSPSY